VGAHSVFSALFVLELQRVVVSSHCHKSVLGFATGIHKFFDAQVREVENRLLVALWHTDVKNSKLQKCCNETCSKIEGVKQHFKYCLRCGVARYCTRVCQLRHWRKGHHKMCFKA